MISIITRFTGEVQTFRSHEGATVLHFYIHIVQLRYLWGYREYHYFRVDQVVVAVNGAKQLVKAFVSMNSSACLILCFPLESSSMSRARIDS